MAKREPDRIKIERLKLLNDDIEALRQCNDLEILKSLCLELYYGDVDFIANFIEYANKECVDPCTDEEICANFEALATFYINSITKKLWQ